MWDTHSMARYSAVVQEDSPHRRTSEEWWSAFTFSRRTGTLAKRTTIELT